MAYMMSKSALVLLMAGGLSIELFDYLKVDLSK